MSDPNIDPNEPVDLTGTSGALSGFTGNPTETRGALSAIAKAAPGNRAAAKADLESKTAMDIKTIEETIAAIREARKGTANLPLLAFGAGMLRTTPGVASNFAGEVGQGLAAAIPVISGGRQREVEALSNIGTLQQKMAELRRKPEVEELEYQNKLSIETQKLIAQLDAAGVRSNRPFTNPATGEVIFPNHFGPGKHGYSLPGKTGAIIPYEGGTSGGPAKPPTVDPNSPDKIPFLQKMVSPDVTAPDLAFQPNLDKLHEIAVTDPQLARELWQIINYEVDPTTITNQRGAKLEYRDLLRKAQEIDPSYAPAKFKVVQDGRVHWSTGDQVKLVRNAQTSINHVGELMELGAALENGDSQLINAIKQKVAASLGSSVPTSFDAVAKIASDELAKITVGGQTAQADREEMASIFSKVQSGPQLEEAVRKGLKLLRGRLEPMAIEKQRALGDRRKVTADDLLGASKEMFDKVMTTGITTPEDRAKWMGGHTSSSTPTKPPASNVPTYDPKTGTWK